MVFDLVIKNYRCFSDTQPAKITVRPGFTAFVGVNNAGKSTLLKFFYEFRNVFGIFTNANGNLIDVIPEKVPSDDERAVLQCPLFRTSGDAWTRTKERTG